MNFDFNFILVPLIVLFLLIIVIDKLWLKQRKNKGAGNEHKIINMAYDIAPTLLTLTLFTSFVYRSFLIPSSSMVPTLYTGDMIWVNQFIYGLRLPIVNKKVVDISHPDHGDVVVFRYPKDDKTYYIKRVIGLPGDTIRYDNGFLTINGIAIENNESDYKADAALTSQLIPSGKMNDTHLTTAQASEMSNVEESQAIYAQEQQGVHRYNVRYLQGYDSSQFGTFLQENQLLQVDGTGTHWETDIPQGQYFMMGDNRDRSADSRFWGFVPEENLVGKASFIWLHKQSGLHLPSLFSRIGRVD